MYTTGTYLGNYPQNIGQQILKLKVCLILYYKYFKAGF